ncbi:MAG: long-chain-acyl-CoA synthetase [Pseudomonadales bacterium]|nr:long-chain-acyl-CoA synthetase [Pseudomonadales bacterium]
MIDNDIVRPIDIIKGLPKVIERVPAIIKAVRGSRNATDNDSMPRCFEQTATRYPGNVAIYYEDRKVTYLEFNRKSNQIAHYLESQGIGKGDVVGLYMQNRPEFLICLVGIAKTGAATALINNAQTGKVLTHSLNLVDATTCIVGEELIEPFLEVQKDLNMGKNKVYSVADQDVMTGPGKVLKGFTNLYKECQNSPNTNLAVTNTIRRADHFVYIYTSGTTGMPKAAITDHNRYATMYTSINVIKNLNQNDIYYLPLPLFHATGLVACWGSILSAGASVVIRRRFSASEFWNDIDKYQATIFGYVGELCRYLLNQPKKPSDGQHSLKKMFGNGLRPGIWKEFKLRFQVPHILEFYGASEGNTAFMNILNIDNTVGIGKATLVKYDKEAECVVKDASGYLIKADKGEPGLLIGEITPKTPFIGYTQKDKTESAILRDVFKKGDAWFDTGDMLRGIGCAHYQFVDRLGDTFRWKGENVSTTQVENIIATRPDVSGCAVYGVEIPNTNGKAGMATITPQEGGELDFEGLLSNLKTDVPAYAIPVFLRIKTEIDVTGTFKYKKTDLKKEGFDTSLISEPLYVLIPGEKAYQVLTPEIKKGIDDGKYRF